MFLDLLGARQRGQILPLFGYGDAEQLGDEPFPMSFEPLIAALVQTGSECVAARATDATLDDVPVCRCDYESAHYFSDTGQRTSSSYTVGLARRRSILSQPGDSCELRRDYPAFGSVCLLEGAAFSGCTTDEADNSCEAVCGEVSRKHADLLARSSESVEALAAECLPCASGYCAGVLRAGDRCFFGMQYSLGFGYYPVSIPCDATPEQMLEAQIQANGYLNTCNLQVSEEASCTSSTSAACEDAGVGDAGGEPDIAADAAPGEAR